MIELHTSFTRLVGTRAVFTHCGYLRCNTEKKVIVLLLAKLELFSRNTQLSARCDIKKPVISFLFFTEKDILSTKGQTPGQIQQLPESAQGYPNMGVSP